MRLAGHQKWSIEELPSRISEAEFGLWAQFYLLEPFGDDRSQSAHNTAAIINNIPFRGDDAGEFKVAMLLPQPAQKPKPPQTVKDHLVAVRQIVECFGGKK